MKLFIGGMRGSQPALGSGFDEFGGDTTSLLVVGSQGERLVLDAGTGMRAVAGQLAAGGAGEVTVLFSHYHLDHLAGLTMNPLLYAA
ncbi:MAG: MBL fold metallo-hydrolase, partial [Phycisphaerae bacterium]|nr:MBL fold metallo-hydrolase [Phycisphaerae bacterium]